MWISAATTRTLSLPLSPRTGRGQGLQPGALLLLSPHRKQPPSVSESSCPSLDGLMLLRYQLYAPCDEGQGCSEVVQ